MVSDQYGMVGTRCDSATFTALLAAFSYVEIDIHQLEKEPGKWVRHVEVCYPYNSDSETSLDVYLMVLHWLWSNRSEKWARQDIEEIWSYGVENRWVMGGGSYEFTNVVALVPLIFKMRRSLGLTADQAPQSEDSVVVDFLENHRGYIAAFYALLEARIDGDMSAAGMFLVEQMTTEWPDSPIYQAIYHRYKDGDMTTLAAIIAYEPDEIPTEVNWSHWGSAPRFLFTVVPVGIAEGM